ncbi:DUF6443 domain-containing protein [Ferruginibacter profundus]
MLKKYFFVAAVLFTSQVYAQQALNYVRTWDARIPITDATTMSSRPVTEVLQTTGYVDGLGRPLQTVVKQGSLVTASAVSGDMVSTNVYDVFGREVQKFLPYTAASTDGLLKASPITEQAAFYNSQLSGQGENYFYSNSDVEASPLNRPVKSYAAGNSWVGSGRGTSMQYLNNTTADDVKIWIVNSAGSYSIGSQPYADGLLVETHTTDEQGHQVVEYKDKEGKVILKKVQVDNTVGESYTGWLCTYYIYDIYNNLRLVIPPKAVVQLINNSWVLSTTVMNELCFRYEYDGSNRMSIKKVPGAAEVFMVYDKWDRLVLTQDGNLRSSNNWIFTKYDYLGRPVITGFYNNTTTTGQAAMQTYVNSQMPGSGPATFESLTGTGIGYTTTVSFPSLSSPQLLSISFYDNYNWATGSSYSSSFATKDNSNDGLFYSTSGSLYAQPLTASSKTKGMVTGTVTYILNSGTNQKLVSSIFCDDRGRALQSKTDNISGGIDIATTQYNFSGQSLMSVTEHKKTATSASIKTITKTEYDPLGRLLQVKKQLIQTGGVQTPEKIIVKNEYDALGQLKRKILAPEFNSNAGLEKLNYDYNIRGWLLGVNKDYIAGTNTNSYFGMELAYDKTTAANAGTYYNNPQYNGNIAGTLWKSKGDGVNRQYDFTYDNVNRLLRADFKQNNADYSWNNYLVNYNMKMGDGIDYNSAYDENGNIKQMQQWGLKINASEQIDNLHYTYYANTNKLQNVIDFKDLATTKLGDFRTSANHIQYGIKSPITTEAAYTTSGGSITDYGYDVNGNMITDRNKDLAGSVGVDQLTGGAITYNHLNLPSVITVAGKGNITYTYDAAGNKLRKTTVENNVSVTAGGSPYTVTVTTTTDYVAGFVYESKNYNNTTVYNALGYADKLQFTGHEEGRVRAAYNNTAAPNTLTGFAFDYMVKDHLGNVRVVLTDEQQVDHYPTATLEANAITQEQTFYDINTGNVVNKPTPLPTEASNLLDYVNDNGTNNPNTFGSPSATSQKMMRLSSATSKTGMGMVLKVMAGDKLDILAKSYYQYLGSNATNSPFNAGDIITSFLGTGGAANAAVQHGGTSSILNSNTSGTVTPLNNFITNSSNTNPYNGVKAGVCYILFDEQFNLVSCQFDPVYIKLGGFKGATGGPDGGLKNHMLQNINVPKNGYLYVYCSNESNINVFFDNLEVIHTRGQILEETTYYPFGLTMQGISSKSAGSLANKARFNGIEQNNDFDLNMCDAFYRNLDPQIGRFWQIDPKTMDMTSVYSTMNNNPILYSDPLGDTTWVYDLLGNQLDIINSKTKNQIHYIDVDKYYDLEAKNTSLGTDIDHAGEPVVNYKKLEKEVRQESTAFFGSNSARDLQNIINDPRNGSKNSLTDGSEALFVASISTKSKELQFHQLDGIKTSEGTINNPDKQVDNVLTNAIQASLFGSGHSHPTKTTYGGALKTLSTTTIPSSRQMGAGGQWELQDFNPILYRASTGSKSQQALFIAARVGFSTYSSGSSSAYPTPGNGIFFYSQFKK